MAYEWQTVEAAAVTLGVSTRTLARRLSDGKIESRLLNGRREVFVCIPDPDPEDSSDATSDAALCVDDAGNLRESANDTALSTQFFDGDDSAASGSDLAIVQHRLALAEDRVRSSELAVCAFRQSAEMASQDARRAKFGALWAWGTVALMAAGVVAATGWTTAKVTRSQAQVEYLEQRLAVAKQDVEQSTTLQNDLRRQVEDARLGAARTQGRLDAMSSATEGKPAAGSKNNPSLMDRLASIFESSR